jgi:NAD+ synthase (glutamine-hydrolysing)
MRICIAQTRVRAAALDKNFDAMKAAIKAARADEADLIIFPEMALPGYFLGDEWERPHFLKRCQTYAEQIAALSNDIAIIFGSVGIDPNARNEDGRVRKYNAAFVAQGGRLLVNEALQLPFWPKSLMPNYREFDDSRHFYDLRKLALERGLAAEQLLHSAVIRRRDGSSAHLGIGLCEDAWDQDYTFKPYASLCKTQPRPDVLINISCSPFTLGKQSKRKKLFCALASATGLPVIYVNAVGSQNVGKTIFSFDGQSGVYVGNNFFPAADCFSESIQTISPFASTPTTKRLQNTSIEANRAEEIQIALEHGLRFLREEWALNKVVIGVSGGIDSALSAVIHARVFGAENVSCVNLPSQYNSQLTMDAARSLAKNLGCAYASLSIEESVKLTLRQLEDARKQGILLPTQLNPLVPENIQARDRGSRLVAGVAAAVGAVFPCNANKTEMTVGYSTLYGDHAGYLAPLGDLWKGDVYALAHHYNSTIYGREIIPHDTLTVKPSAELSPHQDVTKGLGDPLHYPYHDALFRLWVEDWNRHDFDSILEAWHLGELPRLVGAEAAQYLAQHLSTAEAFESDLRRWWNAYIGMGAFKRIQAPPVLALTRRAFGFDHREAVGLHLGRGK